MGHVHSFDEQWIRYHSYTMQCEGEIYVMIITIDY